MAIEKTKCIAPKDRDGDLGQDAAKNRAINRAIAAYVFPTLFGLPVIVVTAGLPAAVAVFFIVLFFGFWSVSDSFFTWWLERRLFCLDDDRNHCAVGIVWNTDKPGDKTGFEAFDNDFSLNLLLSPAAPGDSDRVFLSQANLVAPQPAIAAEGLSTFGGATTAARRFPFNEVASGRFDGDPSPRAGDWTTATGLSGQSAIWQDGTGARDILVPHTQLLHCEFEGDAIANLKEWMPVVIGVSTVIAAALAISAIIVAGILTGLVVTLLIALPYFLIFLLLGALLIKALSHEGNPADAADPNDKQAGKVTGVTIKPGVPWDQNFDMVVLSGRWVYDGGHTRGWNEIHPVRHVQFWTSGDTERTRATMGMPLLRPTTDTEAKKIADDFCMQLGMRQQPVQANIEQQYAYHPNVG